MADFDPKNDTTPALAGYHRGSGKFPTVAALKTAIAASGVSASYPAATMRTMTKNDLVFACVTHSITVVGL